MIDYSVTDVFGTLRVRVAQVSSRLEEQGVKEL